jgi:hypothetical protein
MSDSRTTLPKSDSPLEMSKTESPVTHTALVAVKNASTIDNGSPVDETGSASRMAPIVMIPT